MTEKINELIKNYGFDRWYLSPQGVILLLSSYKEYENTLDTPVVHPYYPISNMAYHSTKALIKALNEMGIKASDYTGTGLKSMLADCASGVIGKNSLCYIGEYGSRFVISAVQTNLTGGNEPQNTAMTLDNTCLNCKICQNACPTGAIKGDGTITRELCLRDMQSHTHVIAEDLRPLIKNSLLGCDICQRVCPKNTRLEKQKIPQEITDVFNLKKLLSGDITGVNELIGNNYARKTKLIKSALIVAGNLCDASCEDEIKALLNHQDPIVKEYALWALNKIKEQTK